MDAGAPRFLRSLVAPPGVTQEKKLCKALERPRSFTSNPFLLTETPSPRMLQEWSWRNLPLPLRYERCRTVSSPPSQHARARPDSSPLERDGFVLDRAGSTGARIYRHVDARRVVVHYHHGGDTLTRKTLRSVLLAVNWTEAAAKRLGLVLTPTRALSEKAGGIFGPVPCRGPWVV